MNIRVESMNQNNVIYLQHITARAIDSYTFDTIC